MSAGKVTTATITAMHIHGDSQDFQVASGVEGDQNHVDDEDSSLALVS